MSEITMSDITTFASRTKASLRGELLDAAADLLAEKGYAGLRIADVAARVGVSRQTVYNEFGSKPLLVKAVALRTTSAFLDGVHQRLADAPDLLSGIRRAVLYTLEHAAENRLVAAALGTADDLLPLLTTRGEPVLRAATELTAAQYLEREPGIAALQAELLAETVVRLTLSHLVLRTRSPADAADAVCAVIAPLLRHYANAGQRGPSSRKKGRGR